MKSAEDELLAPGQPGHVRDQGLRVCRVRRRDTDDRPRRVLAQPARVAQHVPDRHRHQHHPHDDAQADAVAEADARGVRRDAGRERIDRRAQHPRAGPEEDDRGGDDPVVAERERQRDEQHEEAQRLLPHPVGRPAEREDAHEDRDQDRAAVAEAQRQAPDPGLDRSGLHRHRDERADREDEQEDHRRAVQEALLVGAHEPAVVLDPVQAVRRRDPQLLEALGERGLNALLVALRRPSTTAARGRCRGPGRPSSSSLSAPAGTKNDATQTSSQDRREDRERGRELELLRRRLGFSARGIGASRGAPRRHGRSIMRTRNRFPAMGRTRH